ncbi:MAG: hypothetical protein U9Q22_06130 [Candidatus Altiarchaeota archaeon]|nr:hypothetical protein [Candidatus Altiarchaeota archaeon]
MKRNLDSKGFAVSPFVIIALILLGAILAVHFTKIDDTKSKSIAREGKLNKAILNIEEPKATLQSRALFSAYQAAYDAGKKGISDEDELKKFLREKIAEDLNSKSELDDVTLSGNFKVAVDDSDKKKGFRVHTIPEGTKKVEVVGDVVMSSTVGVDKFVGARIFLLRDLAEDDTKERFSRHLADILKEKLEKEFGAKCKVNLKQGGYDMNISCERKGAPPSNPPVNDRNYAARFFENSIVDLEDDVVKGECFPEFNDNKCIIKFKPKEMTVEIDKKFI